MFIYISLLLLCAVYISKNIIFARNILLFHPTNFLAWHSTIFNALKHAFNGTLLHNNSVRAYKCRDLYISCMISLLSTRYLYTHFRNLSHIHNDFWLCRCFSEWAIYYIYIQELFKMLQTHISKIKHFREKCFMQKLYDLEEDIRLVWSWEIVEIWRLRKDHFYMHICAYVCARARARVCVCVKSEEGGRKGKLMSCCTQFFETCNCQFKIQTLLNFVKV